MTDQGQLRQWITSPITWQLPAYRTSLGSAIPGPLDEIKYVEGEGEETKPRRIGLVLHGPISEESSEGMVSNGDIKIPMRTTQQDIKR